MTRVIGGHWSPNPSDTSPWVKAKIPPEHLPDISGSSTNWTCLLPCPTTTYTNISEYIDDIWLLYAIYIYTYHRFTYYHNLRTRYLYIPIGSMYGIYANIGGTLMVNVTIYIAYMDPMGYIYIVWCFFHNINLSQTHAWPRRPCVRSASGPLIRSRSSGPSKCRWFLSIRTVIRFEKYYV